MHLRNAHTSRTYWSRVSQFVLHFLFFNVSIIRQDHLLPKVPEQANFCSSLQYSRAEID